jgi:chromosome segregation ATPase
MAGSTEPGRHDAQRQALSSLLARFTADRDALITSIQTCQERIAHLLTRLDGEPAAGATPPARTTAGGDEAVQAELERVRRECLGAVAAARHDASDARTRLEALARELAARVPSAVPPGELEAVRAGHARLAERVDTLAETVSSATATLRSEVGRMESTMGNYLDVSLRAVTDGFTAELAAVREELLRLGAGLADVTAQARTVPELRAAVAALGDEVRRQEPALAERLESRIAGVAETWDARLAAVLAAPRADAGALAAVRREVARAETALAERLEARLARLEDGRDAEVRTLREQVRQLAGAQAAERATAAGLGELRLAIEHLREHLGRTEALVEDRLQARVRAAVDGWHGELRAVREAVAAVAARQADQAAAGDTLTEVRHGMAALRAEIVRLETTIGERVDAHVRAAAGSWDSEARLLRARMDDLATLLARRAAERERHAARRSALVRGLCAPVAALRAAGAWLPGARTAASVLISVSRMRPSPLFRHPRRASA